MNADGESKARPERDGTGASSSLGERLIFILAISASAFLIFLVQPMVGKRILPWYGGTPAVWTLCLAFYQTTLFLGYAYAHLLIRFATPSQQLGVHALFVVAGIWVLPVLPGEAWQPDEVVDPGGQILAMLGANVALPFFVLASTGPLVQAWFARRHPRSSPYPLYALSNLGSLAALFAYPFLVEPRLPLSDTGQLWSYGFGGVAFAVLCCAALAWRSVPGSKGAGSSADGRLRIDLARCGRWLLLAGSAVVVMMGVTNELCIDVASVPFLWILPLSTYLLTFVLCFASERVVRRAPYVLLAVVGFLLSLGHAIWLPWLEPPGRVFLQSPPVQIASYCVLLFAICMLLHGELYRLRPPARALTAFYLFVSAGGALGGIFVGIVAPLIFDDYYELVTGLGLSALLLLRVSAKDPSSLPYGPAAPWRRAFAGTTAILLLGYVGWATARPNDALRYRVRSFFGVYRVLGAGEGEKRSQRHLMSGSTLHGVQFDDPWRKLPSSYYGRATGVGLVMGRREAPRAARIGVIGLGVGTLAAYARAGDVIRFYEIDPVVVRIARDLGFFTFLQDSAGTVEIVIGDGRLSLANERARDLPQAFDYLVVDAFSSDAIPVHLLTVEAFEHYVAALAPGGLLAVHASNRHFELVPLVMRVGRELGLESLQVTTLPSPRLQSQASQWVWLGRGAARMKRLEGELRRQQQSLGLEPAEVRLVHGRTAKLAWVPVWTDDHSDLFGLLRRRGGG